MQKLRKIRRLSDSFFAGIDPGKSGAFAVIDLEGRFVAVHDTPSTDDEKADLVRKYKGRIRLCTLEKVRTMPGQGISSAMKFGKGKGVWRGVLAALQIPRQFVTSSEWHKIKGPVPKKKKKKDRKVQSREVARQLWPSAPIELVKDTDRAEALLIAEYGRRKFLGEK